MKPSPVLLAVMLGVGLVLGGGAVALLARDLSRAGSGHSPSAPTSAGPEDPSEQVSPVLERAPRVVPDAATAAMPERTPPQAREDALFGEALRAHALAGFARGWAEHRKDSLPEATRARLLTEFEELVRTTPEAWGRAQGRLANEQDARRSALEESDGVAWLAQVPADDPELEQLPRDPERFAALFRAQSSGAVLAGLGLGDQDPLAEGSVVVFPAGVFAVPDLTRGREPFPRDVRVRGAGMDLTLLVLDCLRPRGALERFTLEDCTVFVDNSIADVRSAPTLLTLRRVRVVGFDCGAGGSYALDVRASAISAVQTRFEAGYGRNPGGYANLMRPATPLVARFEACTFERMSLAGARTSGVVFSDCAMLDMLEEPPTGPAYLDCQVTLLPSEARYDESVRKRDLNDLFPDWRARLERR